MSPAVIAIARALGDCFFLPASWDKRFARQMAYVAEHSPDKDLTDKQIANLIRLAHKYRRQMPTGALEAALDESERAADRRVPGRSRRASRFQEG